MRTFLTASVVLNGAAVIVVFKDAAGPGTEDKLFGYYIYASNRRGEPLSDNRYLDSAEACEKRAMEELKELGCGPPPV